MGVLGVREWESRLPSRACSFSSAGEPAKRERKLSMDPIVLVMVVMVMVMVVMVMVVMVMVMVVVMVVEVVRWRRSDRQTHRKKRLWWCTLC